MERNELGLVRPGACAPHLLQTGLTADHPIQSYLKIAHALRDDAALVDTFLHHRARNYTVDDCLDFVASTGLAFQGWYHRRRTTRTTCSHHPVDPTSRKCIAGEHIWSVMERMQTLTAERQLSDGFFGA